jgi:hypothetical protein
MKKEIKFYLNIIYLFFIVSISISLSVNKTDKSLKHTSNKNTFHSNPVKDWSNVNNSEKKEYLEHLYNTTKSE